MSLSESIKSMRIKALLSQEELAAKLHVTVGTINRWENGKTRPTISAMKNIKEFCENSHLSFEEIESEWIKGRMD